MSTIMGMMTTMRTTMTIEQQEDAKYRNLMPLPGKCVLRPDPAPDVVGSIIVPAMAQGRTVTDVALPCTVVSVGYGRFRDSTRRRPWPGVTPEDFGIGDRVLVRMTLENLNRRYIVSDVRRVDGVLED